jgi:membrane protein involved in colicin uptake
VLGQKAGPEAVVKKGAAQEPLEAERLRRAAYEALETERRVAYEVEKQAVCEAKRRAAYEVLGLHYSEAEVRAVYEAKRRADQSIEAKRRAAQEDLRDGSGVSSRNSSWVSVKSTGVSSWSSSSGSSSSGSSSMKSWVEVSKGGITKSNAVSHERMDIDARKSCHVTFCQRNLNLLHRFAS